MKINILLFLTAATLVSCNKMSPEERAEKEKVVTQAYAQLGTLYKKALATGPVASTSEVCDGSKDMQKDPSHVEFFHVDELKKFSTTNADAFKAASEEWKTKSPMKDDSPWMWMSTARYYLDDKFHSLPADLSGLHLSDAYSYVTETEPGSFFTVSQWAVIVPDNPAECAMPKMIDDESFDSGYFKGKVLLYDRKTLELICATPIEVVNSKSLSHTEYHGRRGALINTFKKSPEEVVTSDFRDNFQMALRKAFPKYNVDVNGHMD
jgi:hypothetical protein